MRQTGGGPTFATAGAASMTAAYAAALGLPLAAGGGAARYAEIVGAPIQ